jgi:hypothetical protein
MWHVPHFEKMLYDNAQLARLYTRAWQVTREERYRRVATETCEYLLREMRHPDGGFFSSQDADSEGVEGRFFVWSYDELVSVAGEDVPMVFGSAPRGNWEGTNVLWRPHPVEAVAEELGSDRDELAHRVEAARRKLFEIRESRVRPATDDKVLAAWNGLAVSALAEAGRAFGEPRYVEAAVGAADFVLMRLRDGSRRLLRSWRDGKPGRAGYADDHALMADACLTLYETTFDVRWFDEARALADELLRLFWDRERGGFFQTGSDAERLVVRPKELFDNAVPSGNSAAADVLQRMALMTGEQEYEGAGLSALRLVREQMAEAPHGFGQALSALDLYVSPVPEVAVIGDPQGDDTRALVAEVTTKRFLPNHVLAVAAPDDDRSRKTVPLLRDRVADGGNSLAYVCERFVCRLPVSQPEELAKELTGRTS